MPKKRKSERIVDRKLIRSAREVPIPFRRISQNVRLLKTSAGNRIIVMPGVKHWELRALLPSNWRNKEYHYESGRMRMRHGLVFTAQTVDSRRNKFRIQCRAIRRHYSTTHEARMLLHLQGKGFHIEQPLAILINQAGERFIVTRYIEEKTHGSFSDVKEVEARLKGMGIRPVDLYEYGRQNYVFAVGPDGRPAVYLIDVEHYHSTDAKSRLHAKRMRR